MEFARISKWFFLCAAVTFEWLHGAVERVDVVLYVLRRNIRGSLTLDSLMLDLWAARGRTAGVGCGRNWELNLV